MDPQENYRELLQEVAEVARGCGRDPSEITTIAVTKTHPLETILPVYKAGCRHFGENRMQEALEKQEHAPGDLDWHLIGTLQAKKVRKAIGRFSLIHSVDSLKLAQRISVVSEELGVATSILLQVNTSGELSKQGFTPEELLATYDAIQALPALQVEGLMTIAPFTDDRDLIRRSFADLRKLKERADPALIHLSMGMTHDYPIAIQEGATLLRVGSRLFGSRSSG